MRALLPFLLACGPAPAVVGDPISDDAADTGPSVAVDSGDTGTVAVDSPCLLDEERLTCTHQTWSVRIAGEDRLVHWQVPSTPAPDAGYPAVILFQGTGVPADRSWEADPDAPLGLFHQVRTTRALLDAGFAVITPNAHGSGLLYWDTNQPPWSTSWSSAPDHQLMLALRDAVTDGTFGDLDPQRMAAGGFSSGGYMTSRMAVSYPGTFQALFIVSASYATCAGALCVVPSLPADHPPTLFLHGESDLIVPVSTARAYHDRLAEQGTPVSAVLDADAGHVWLPEAPDAVTAWLESWLLP